MKNLDQFLNEILEETGVDLSSVSKEEAIKELKDAIEIVTIYKEEYPLELKMAIGELIKQAAVNVTQFSIDKAADEIVLEKFANDIENLKLFYPNLFHQLADSVTNPFRSNDEEGEE